MKRSIIALLIAAISLFTFVACGDTNVDDLIGNDNVYNVKGPNKTNISVINFDGGIGTVWLDKAAERYAELNQNRSFGNGKTGIYIDVIRGSGMNLSLMASQAYNIYFHERNSDINDLAQNGVLLDITDIVTDKDREGGKLDDIIYTQKLDALKGNDGKYYGLPHYEFFGGITYDRELFDEFNTYFAHEDETEKNIYQSTKYGSEFFINSDSSRKSVGPDGIENTLDDGLPSSLAQMIILMDYFKQITGCAPIVLSGTYVNYSNYLLAGLWAALAGKQQMTNYYNLTGEIEVVTGYKNESLFPGIDYIKKPITEKITLTEETGYRNQEMAAKYYAIAMLEIMEREGFFSTESYMGTVDHYTAQKCLIYDGVGRYTRTAMLIEGSYWYNEAVEGGSFNSYKTLSGSDEERDLRFMSLPTSYYTDVNPNPGKTALLDIGIGVGVINGNIKNDIEIVEACKDFLAFLYSANELAEFTATTGLTRPINYSITDTQKNRMSSYAKNLLNMRESEGESNIVYYAGNTDTFKRAKARIKIALELPVNPKIPNENITYITPIRTASKNSEEYNYGTRALFENTKLTNEIWKQYTK